MLFEQNNFHLPDHDHASDASADIDADSAVDVGEFIAAEFGEKVLPPLLVQEGQLTQQDIEDLELRGTVVEQIDDSYKVFETLAEVRADLATKIEKNRSLTAALGSIGGMFGGCGVFHVHGASGVGSGMQMPGSVGNLGRGSGHAVSSSSASLSSAVEQVWAISGGSRDQVIAALSMLLPSLRLLLDSVGVGKLFEFGPAQTVSVDYLIQLAA